jgi:uncharacterized protein YndB with AHSA1/START domain
MTKTMPVAPVRKSITVAATPERAFEIFTAGMVRWWSRQYTINASPIKDIVIEPRVDGRWFERGEDGSECQWGRVLAWQPPSRVVLAWQITPSFSYDPDLLTELDVRFIAEGGGTRVELEHRLDSYGAAAGEMFTIFDGGWPGLLEGFAREAA